MPIVTSRTKFGCWFISNSWINKIMGKKVYPPKGGANAVSRWGPIEGLSNLYCTGERKWGFQKHQRKSTFFESPKTFIVQMGG